MTEKSENWLSEVDSRSIAIPPTGDPRIRMAGKGGQAKATKEMGGHVGHGRHGERVRAISAPGRARCAQCGRHSSLLHDTGILGDSSVTDPMVFVFYGPMTEDGAREGFRGKHDGGRIEGGFFPPLPHSVAVERTNVVRVTRTIAAMNVLHSPPFRAAPGT